mgnify:FL=1
MYKRQGEAPSDLAAEVATLLDAWVKDDAPRLDADDDGFHDDAGPAVFDAVLEPVAAAVMAPVYGALVPVLDDIRSLGGDDGASLVDKDLRTLLGRDVEGPFNLRYCGGGDLDQCATDLWAVVETASRGLAEEYGSEDTSTWLSEGQRLGFAPGLIEDTFRATNRPTFQQVVEWAPADG